MQYDVPDLWKDVEGHCSRNYLTASTLGIEEFDVLILYENLLLEEVKQWNAATMEYGNVENIQSMYWSKNIIHNLCDKTLKNSIGKT